jgi:hypothetical protein
MYRTDERNHNIHQIHANRASSGSVATQRGLI